MPTFEKAFADVVGMEGGYVNDPADSGGETIFGITVAVARECGYAGPMRAMPVTTARGIYKARYWDALRLDDVAEISGLVAIELFEQAVNMGGQRAALNFQRTLNVMNRAGTDYPEVAEDGRLGPVTVRAFYQFTWKRGHEGVTVIRSALNCLQGAFYLDLAARRGKDERFVYGWIKNRVAS